MRSMAVALYESEPGCRDPSSSGSFGTCQSARVPLLDVGAALPLEQFLTPDPLRVTAVPNLSSIAPFVGK